MTSSRMTSPRRLSRADRKEQILAAATRAFARAGFAATGLDDVVDEAGVSRAILYRHFESKSQLYQAVLQRARRRLHHAVGDPPYTEAIIDDLLVAASGDSNGFRLLFHHTARESEFRQDTDRFSADMVDLALRHLHPLISDAQWSEWAAHLAPAVTIAAITAWLDAGQPDPNHAATRIRTVMRSIIEAAGAPVSPPA